MVFLMILAESNPRVRISDPWFLNEFSMVFFDDFSGVETKGPNFGPLVSTEKNLAWCFFADFSGVETKGPNFGPLVST